MKVFPFVEAQGISLIESMLTLVGWWNVWRRVILDHMADFDLYPIASLIDVLIASIPFFVLLYIVESSRCERWNKYALILYLRGEKWKVLAFTLFREVKLKWLNIKIMKWNFSRILEKSQWTSFCSSKKRQKYGLIKCKGYFLTRDQYIFIAIQEKILL